MSRSLNQVQLIGFVGQDPELKYTSSGIAVATFSMATNEAWKDQDGNAKEKTEWHNIVAWRKLAEVIGEYIKKGSKVYIQGKLTHRSYDDKNDIKRYTTEVVMDQLIMLDSKQGATTAPPPPEEKQAPDEKVDDLPF
jgi:single-strand DNA-binding protein